MVDAVYIATSGEDDNIFVIVWMLVIHTKLYFAYGSKTLTATMAILINEFWPFVAATRDVETHVYFEKKQLDIMR